MRVLTAVLILLIAFSAAAQDENDDWQVVFYAINQEPTIYFIGPDGVHDEIRLPNEVQAGWKTLKISPNGRYVVYEADKDIDRSFSVHVFDPQTGVTRQLLDDQLVPDFSGYEQVVFHPDGDQIVARFAIFAGEGSGYAWHNYREVVVDLATGELEIQPEDSNLVREWSGGTEVRNIHVTALPGEFPDPYQETWRTVEWPGFDEPLSLIMVITPEGTHDAGDTLVTGEHIVSSFLPVPSYPEGETTGSYFPIIRYQQPDGTSYLVFIDLPSSESYPYSLGFPYTSARWVMDGHYIYTQVRLLSTNPPNTFVLIARDGTLLSFDNIRSCYAFITGTPDGWLAFNRCEPNTISHFTLIDGELQETVLLELPHTEQWQVLEKPLLGYSLEEIIPFPELAPILGAG